MKLTYDQLDRDKLFLNAAASDLNSIEENIIENIDEWNENLWMKLEKQSRSSTFAYTPVAYATLNDLFRHSNARLAIQNFGVMFSMEI